MKQLKLAFLWHQHQPYYKLNGEYRLPWVRLHAIKDYLDLCLILYDYPKIKQTFNLVPSLLMQIQDYANDIANERILELTKKRTTDLSDNDKNEILKSFFICNEENMIKPYERFNELFNKSQTSGIQAFSDQDWLDLQVWYNLTWFGPISRESSELKYLFAKQRNYSEEEKLMMLKVQHDILLEIVPTFNRLWRLGQIEISTSPFYHPILPLLINSNSALEATPEMKVPAPAFQFPEDGDAQISYGIDCIIDMLRRKPRGMWPSEGSVSDETIKLINLAGIRWVATDEQVMMNSLNNSVDRLERFFPRRYRAESTDIHIFFREHFLSDMIGFQYSSWEPDKAAEDFVNRLKYVRWELTSKYGEECLDSAVVPIIMDGENCWEFYKDNGKPFLDELYQRLSDSDEIRTVTITEALDYEKQYVEDIKSVKAGSWIDGNFNIWLGQDEHVKAWNALLETRMYVELKKQTAPFELIKQAMETIYIAEGSDWFWWYSDSHQAPNKYDFDIMFREHLKNIYKLFNEAYPVYLNEPIAKVNKVQIFQQPKTKIEPDLEKDEPDSWSGAGYYIASMAMDSMHSGGSKLSGILFGNNDDGIFLRLELREELSNEDKIIIEGLNNFKTTIIISKDNLNAQGTEVKFSRSQNYLKLFIPFLNDVPEVELQFRMISKSGVTNYPRQGTIKIPRQGTIKINIIR